MFSHRCWPVIAWVAVSQALVLPAGGAVCDGLSMTSENDAITAFRNYAIPITIKFHIHSDTGGPSPKTRDVSLMTAGLPGFHIVLGPLSPGGAPTDLGSFLPGEAEDALRQLCSNYDTFFGAIKGLNLGLRKRALPEPVLPAGQASQEFFAVDLNGDGIPDSVEVQPGAVYVHLLSSTGASFSSHSYPVGPNAFFGLAGDFNGDGKPDLAISNNGNSQGNGSGVSILLGNGDGTFQAAKTTSINGNPFAIASGDFDGDGKLDVAVTDLSSAVVWVLLGNGDGTLQAAVSYSSGTAIAFDNILYSIVAADFNNDGRIDLALLDADPQSVSVLLSKGDGTFQAAIVSPVGGVARGTRGYLSFADLNHDGNLDLAVAYHDSNSIKVLLGNANGTFRQSADYVIGSSPGSLGIAPLDDGTFFFISVDLITGDVLLNWSPGDGTLNAPPLYTLGKALTSIAAGDLNGDKVPDIIANDSQNGAVQVMLAKTGGGFGAPVAYPLGSGGANGVIIPQSLAVGDLNGDGKTDVVAVGFGTVNVFLGNGDGTLQAAQTSTIGTFPNGVVLADFNGDGKLDAAVVDGGSSGGSGPSGPVWILFGKGDGTFQAPVSYSVGSLHATSLVAADLNGDGKPDLAMVTSTVFNASPFIPGAVAILLNNGDGTFRAGISLQPGASAQPIAIAAGDLNGDGKIDLAVGVQDTTNGDGAAIFLGNGDGTFRVVPSFAAGESNVYNVAITDLDQDGKADLILSFCCGLSDATYSLGKGDGTFQSSQHITAGANPVGISVTDFNSDGLPDLVFADKSSGFSYVVAMNGFFPVTSGSCTYYIGPSLLQATTAGGTFNVHIGTDASCAWSATETPSWVTALNATSGSGSGSITLNVAANAGGARAATFNVAGRVITVTQAAVGCGFALDSAGRGFAAAGGSGTIAVTANAGCAWSFNGAPAWVTFTSSSGNGGGLASYTVAANSGPARSATVTVGAISYTIEQSAGSLAGLAAVGSLAQVATGGPWTFTLDAVNLGGASATARVNFSDNSGNPLLLPLTFPQSSSTAGAELAATLDRTVAPNAQVILQSMGSASTQTATGWGQLQATGSVGGFGIFSYPALGWNAVVPIETRNAEKYYLAFDNTGSVTTGIAIANLTALAASVTVIIRDDTGAQLGTGTINLSASGHTSFMLNDAQLGFAVTNGKRGTIEFDTPPGGQISVLGLRANGTALTTLPVLASTDPAGGGIAHATYNGGFTSVFYIVNTGTSSTQFTLSFFDESGNPLSVPLTLPQTGTNTTTSTLTQTLAPGAMLVVQTLGNDQAASVVGSAQLTTGGSISGFEIFRWTTFGQEASVPLETRAPGSYVLVFDDTNGLTTGVALSNVAASAASVTVKIYDDMGTLLSTSAVNLSGKGHTSFLLPTNYAATANRRGMVEFVVPAGGNIDLIGLRAKNDGTLTTIPVLAR